MTGDTRCCLPSVRTTERQQMSRKTRHAHVCNGIFPPKQGSDSVWSTTLMTLLWTKSAHYADQDVRYS